jgi:hypothetical protein
MIGHDRKWLCQNFAHLCLYPKATITELGTLSSEKFKISGDGTNKLKTGNTQL